MTLHPRRLVPVLATAVGLLVAPLPAVAGAPPVVDESRLQPALSAGFAPWTCQTKAGGPVCRGEFHYSGEWGPADLTCREEELWGRTEIDRYQTRYYDTDYLDSHREFRTKNVDHLATTPTGPDVVTITTNVRFKETFAVPGDDSTRTIVSHGIGWDIRPARGPAVWRAVGTVVESPDGDGTFSGMVTSSSGNTRYQDAPLPDVLSDDTFVAAVCEAASAGS